MAKRLVVCCDGTWNTADQRKNDRACPTNVIRLALSIAAVDRDGVEQRVYYHPGVGTSRWQHWSGGALGVGLSVNVLDAYQFLIDNYDDGDELYFFGFSRGAFTVRSIAGMVRNCGVLRPQNRDRKHEAYRLYRSPTDKPKGMASTLFRRGYSFEPEIRFIGVWDTVGALGIPPIGPPSLYALTKQINRRWSFHDTQLSSHVRAAFHALAIDEQRKAFEPTLWTQPPNATGQEIEQVWFAGIHCDVGGGLADSSLSDLTLLWMAQKARQHHLEFVQGAFPPARPGAARLDPRETAEFTVAPNPDCLPHASRIGLYRLVRPWHRPIDTPQGGGSGPGQNVAATAVQLHQSKPKQYQPPGLVAYLARIDRPEHAKVPSTFTPT